MSKDKKREESKSPSKVTVEAEVALLGLLVAIISLIGILNQGWLGSFLTFCCSFIFGSMYLLILFFNMYLGLYLFFKKKKPTFAIGLNSLATILLLFFLLVAASIYKDAEMGNWYAYFSEHFNQIKIASTKVDISKIHLIGGGAVGYFTYALLVTFLDTIVATIVIFLIIAGCSYILFKNPSIKLYKKAKSWIIRIKEKKENKNADIESVIKDEDYFEECSNFESSPFNNTEQVKIEETQTKKRRLSFDIFREPLFEEEEPIISNSQENNVVVKEEVTTPRTYTAEELEFYGDEDLEFYNEDLPNQVEEPIIDDLSFQINTDSVAEDIIEDSTSSIDNIRQAEAAFEQETKGTPFVADEIKVEPIVEENLDDIYNLLKDNMENNASQDLKDEVEANCEAINQKLVELNIRARVTDYIIGPCVTRYELVPDNGVRVSSIVNIENDLKLALAAVKTRMEAPIPGKSAVGIEVANKKRYPVYLKEVIKPFKDNPNKLLVGIGRDLNNKEVVLNIDSMPHLLVAGATGSGKSVCINSMIVSLIMRASPEDVKMILIDPKKVEMLPYTHMPHLLCPVVIDPKKASVALKKVVVEMTRRYDEFAANGTKNIDAYNKRMVSMGEKPLPKIVVIIDELADLMLVAAKDVEESIQRITQMARAAGIYLIVATQRPSVDVITGVIKANIPSRIAFTVSSQVDSRTIIDRAGAEELLGKGDMLMDIAGSGALNRVQGVYVSDDEIMAVVNFIKDKYSVEYNDAFMNLEEEKNVVINNLGVNEENNKGVNNDDKLYEDIKDYVIRNQKASISILQRYFSLGYSRAARFIDRLEDDGVIGASNGAKSRDVLISYNKEDNTNE